MTGFNLTTVAVYQDLRCNASLVVNDIVEPSPGNLVVVIWVTLDDTIGQSYGESVRYYQLTRLVAPIEMKGSVACRTQNH